MNADDYDKFVCAEILDKQKHPTLHDIVFKQMMHIWRVKHEKSMHG